MARTYYTNRYVCSVLEEMRECIKTLNFSYLPGLIEEAQSMANRMEAGLADYKDLIELREERSDLKAEVMQLRKEKKELEKKLGKKSKKDDDYE